MMYGLNPIKGLSWYKTENLGDALTFICGYCGDKVSTNQGYYANAPGVVSYIRICPSCHLPTYFSQEGSRFPQSMVGSSISNVPDGINNLYNEARSCFCVGAFTGSVLLSRKLLMNISVQEGAVEGKNFIFYIEHLATCGFIPPNGRKWVDYIRIKGNEATHEIHVMNKEDASSLIIFSEMLLRFIYQFPNMIPSSNP
jgi:hypothetical protein